MLNTNQKTSIYAKVGAIKSTIGKLTKDSTNPFFNSKYFDINQLLEKVEPLLKDNGLMILQPIIDEHVVTQIIEIETGAILESSIKLPEINDPQKIGSAITYYRRYSLQSLLALQAEDDDANKASGQTESKSNKAEDNRPWLSENQLKQAIDRIKSGEKGVFEKIDAAFKMKKQYREDLKSAA